MSRNGLFAVALTIAGFALTAADASAQFRNRGGRGPGNQSNGFGNQYYGNNYGNNGITIPGTNFTIPGTGNNNYGNNNYGNSGFPYLGNYDNRNLQGYNNGRYSNSYPGYNNGQYYNSTPGYSPYSQSMISPANYATTVDTSKIARVTVELPDQDAQVWVNDTALAPTLGMDRQFQSPALDPAKNYSYTVKARWMVDGKAVEKTRDLKVEPGKSSTVSFR